MKSTLLGIGFFLLFTGCDDSKNPLSDPQTAKADERLVGVWRCGDEYYHVGHAGKKFPPGVLRVVVVAHNEADVKPPSEYLAFPTVLGDKTYLNVVTDEKQVKRLDESGWKSDAVECYMLFIKYQVDDDKLVAWPIDEEVKEQAVKAGKVKGIVEEGKPARFIDTTENIVRYIADAGDVLWNARDTGRFERVITHPQKTGRPSSLLSEYLGKHVTPTPPLRPLGSGLIVDKNFIIWEKGKAVGIWGVDGSEMPSQR